MPTPPPPCQHLGPQCRRLQVTLRIGSLEEGDESLDHEATWLLGHTGNITFLRLWEGDGDLYADATLHVGCKFLKREPDGRSRCAAYGFEGRTPADPRNLQPRQLENDRFRVVEQRKIVTRRLPPPAAPRRALPVVSSDNPCQGAPCRTADNSRGAACCRDLQVEIMCTRRQRRLEAFVRSRQSPYLCKIEREGDFSLGVEMISACGYLEPGGVNCTLHGRKRADGRTAKPDLCFDWPPKKQTLHPGCVFARPRRRSA
ncbi:MAG TPA: hypothetical protein VFL88_12360 [Gemmatimonadales bacterium]|nr:hypothetical protein [Gemmatimonadales bacterium]